VLQNVDDHKEQFVSAEELNVVVIELLQVLKILCGKGYIKTP